MSAHWAVLRRPPRLWWPLRRGLVRPPAWPQRCSPLRLQVTCRHCGMHTLISEMKNNDQAANMLDSYSEIWNNLWLVSNCTLPNCFCSTDGTLIPGGLLPTDVPQEFIASENIIFRALNTSIWPLSRCKTFSDGLYPHRWSPSLLTTRWMMRTGHCTRTNSSPTHTRTPMAAPFMAPSMSLIRWGDMENI